MKPLCILLCLSVVLLFSCEKEKGIVLLRVQNVSGIDYANVRLVTVTGPMFDFGKVAKQTTTPYVDAKGYHPVCVTTKVTINGQELGDEPPNCRLMQIAPFAPGRYTLQIEVTAPDGIVLKKLVKE